MKTAYLMTFILCLPFLRPALAADIISADAKSGIQVTSSADRKFVSFKFCTDVKNPSSCERLGESKWYSKTQLEGEKAWNYAKASGDGVLSAYFTVLTGLSIGMAFPTAGAALIVTPPLAAAGVVYGVKTRNRLREAKLLSPEFLNDQLLRSQNNGTEFFEEEVQSIKNILEVVDQDNK